MRMHANISNEVRRGIYKRDGFRCALCDSTEGLQIHHVIPRGVGGSSSPMNLICLCWRCHNAAHGSMCCDIPKDTTPEELRRLHATIMADMEQACVEYVSDLYAEKGEIWSPW